MPLPSGSKTPVDPQAAAYHVSKFVYDRQNDVVKCPQGKCIPFRRIRVRPDGVQLREYRSAAACKDCPVRAQCTKDRHGRTVDIWPWHDAVEAHRQWMESQQAKDLYRKRAEIVEPVFAQIKQNMGFRRWTFRGLEKVKAQWHMLSLTWNLKVIWKRWVEKVSYGAQMAASY